VTPLLRCDDRPQPRRASRIRHDPVIKCIEDERRQ